MRKKWLKALKIIAVTLLGGIIFTVSLPPILHYFDNEENVPIIDETITIDSITPKFFYQTPQEGLKKALVHYDLVHADIVYAQAVLETGNFTSRLCLEHNNLFGLYNSRKGEYYKFNHWTESVEAYKKWIQKKYNPPKDYYLFLEEIHYAEDSSYTNKLKFIINNNSNDEKRSK